MSNDDVEEAFLEDLYAVWKEHGKDILREVARTRPEEIVRAVSQLAVQHFRMQDSRRRTSSAAARDRN